MKLNNLLILPLLLSSLATCDDEFDYNFNYFGNLTYSTLDRSGYEYRSYDIDNVDNGGNISSFSKLGAQLNLNKDNFDFNIQALAREYDDSLESDLTWLNVKYTYENYAIRIGRMQFPLFLNSNSLDVDYVHLWTKAPVEVYGIFPAKSYDGIEFLYQKSFKDIYFDMQVTPYAKLKEDVSIVESLGEIEAKLDDIKNIRMSVEIDDFTLSSSYTQGKLTLPLQGTGLDTLVSSLQSLGFNDLADKYSMQNTKLEFYSLGLNYDNGDFIFSSEYANMKSDSLLPDMQAYYFLGGYRIEKFTPYMMYARNKNDEGFYSVDELTTSSPSIMQQMAVAQLRTGLEKELYKMNSSQKTTSLGVRYDYKKGIAFKFQADRITTSNYGNSTIDGNYERLGFLARESGVDDEPVYMYTLAVSFAF